MVSNSEPLPEGTVIMAGTQYAGRGQMESKWYSEPGKNLTFSILFYPGFLSLNEQFNLNMAISIGIQHALTKLTGTGLSVKWPNDIYFGAKKIGGILIENIVAGNRIKACIVGIGINVNQENFENELETKAGSLYQILQKHVNLELLLPQLCSHIEVAYLKLRTGNYKSIQEEYIKLLYRFNENARYRQNGEIIIGKITGVSDTGFLILETNAGIISCNFKEIEFV